MSAPPSGPASEAATSEPADMTEDEAPTSKPPPPFPPYPPFTAKTAPPSVADTIIAGRGLRLQHKSLPPQPVRPLPRPARPRGPKATDVKMSRRMMRQHARCLRRHGAVLTDRLERIAKPPRRRIIYLWREQANRLPAETIARLRALLDADEPFKPDQAYEYFINMRKTRKTVKKQRAVNQIKKDVQAICADKRFVWARNATVAFARGIQQRLARGGRCYLADGMLKLSDIILDEFCGFMKMRTPSRRSSNAKAKFMMEMSDKVAIWIDGVLSESDDRMLMMDFDEDDDLFAADKFADDFLDMMGGGGLLLQPTSAYLKFTGEMLEAFMILTDSMTAKGQEQLLTYGKFEQSYAEGANELKQAPDFEATEFNSTLAAQLIKDLADTARPKTPDKIAPFMKSMVDICGNYLAQYAEFNKDKGPAFKALVKQMKIKGGAPLYQKEKAKRTFGTAATELERARGLETDHDDPNLTQEIHGKLSALMEGSTPPELKTDMAETLDICSKYLSQSAIDEIERGPAFDLLIKTLESKGGETFTPQYPPIATKYAAAYTLKSAPGLGSVKPDPSTAPKFTAALHAAVDANTPQNLKDDMNAVVDRCGNYLSAFVRDRDKAVEIVVKAMKSSPTKELAKRNNYAMSYATGALETETAPILVPYLPIKDIADENKGKLTQEVATTTPPELKIAVKSAVTDIAKHLSQPVAVRSEAGGQRYPVSYVGKMMESMGDRALFKHKAYAQTYADGAEVLKYAGPLESSPKAEDLQIGIETELNKGIPTRTAPTIVDSLAGTITDASKHLAKVGQEKAEAMDHLVRQMKSEGNITLEKLQGYDQTYIDGARRIENADSLANDKVDKAAYESVRGKLSTLTLKNPNPEYDNVMPVIIDETSKFLSAPFPETEAEKRRVLADLMALKGTEELAKEGAYKMDYTQGGKELIDAPVGVHTSVDPKRKKELEGKMIDTVPNESLKSVLRTPASEGAAYISDAMKGRGEAMDAIKAGLKKEGNAEFLNVGKFNKTYEGAAEMLNKAPSFGGENPNGILLDKVTQRVENVEKAKVSPLAQKHMGSAISMASNYIADVATKECGLDPKQIAAWNASGGGNLKKSESPTGDAEKSKHDLPAITSDAEKSKHDLSAISSDAEKSKHDLLQKEKSKSMLELKKAGSEVALPRKGEPTDEEHEQSLAILHKQLRAKGGETLYSQPPTSVTHTQASDWISQKPPMHVDKSVKESSDTARLHQKFERKLSGLVSGVTPPRMKDSMQDDQFKERKEFEDQYYAAVAGAREVLDRSSAAAGSAASLHSAVSGSSAVFTDVVIESSRIISECFVSANYKALVKDALISEMQKRRNEIIVDDNGATETSFFAAQRLKKAKSLDVEEPTRLSYGLRKKLDEIIRCRSMARKLTATMKDHVKESADYLSGVVTTPDEQIEAYVAMLTEMEEMDDALLIEGNIPKSYKDSASYLRSLTSYEDQINMSNSALQAIVEKKLNSIMVNVPPRGYTQSILKTVISDSARLLVSYIMLQVERTEALNIIIDQLDREPDGLLLRHGAMRKSNAEGAELLRGKNTDQLFVPSADPVVSRKVQIKLTNMMEYSTPDKYAKIMEDVISDATLYLAVELLKPHVIKVCKCMKNVFVQCELWCDEILRRVARPCCTCTRHVSAQALADLAPGETVSAHPSAPCASAPGVEISFRPCPARSRTCTRADPAFTCPAPNPNAGCDPSTTSYMLYSTQYNRQRQYVVGPTRLPRSPSDSVHMPPGPPSRLPASVSLSPFPSPRRLQPLDSRPTPSSDESQNVSSGSSAMSFFTPLSTSKSSSDDTQESNLSNWNQHSPTTMYAKIYPESDLSPGEAQCDGHSRRSASVKHTRNVHSPIVATDQMADWHSMMVSLTWNVQAWRNWIQDTIDRALVHCHTPQLSEQADESWSLFRRRIATEALQWRQYNLFSRQLTLRLALRYRDKKIVSPTRATVKTPIYMDCQKEMLDIINMFNRWTHWLSVIVKETDSLQVPPDSEISHDDMRWSHFKNKVEGYADDWLKYNMHLKLCWEHQYMSLIKDWLPSWNQQGPVWVMSACGAVPSGAVRAGAVDGEATWVARTTHRGRVLPAALRPSQHCCLLYADGAVHHYTKYQVMCNANVTWVAWRAGAVGARAVRVAPGVHAGRVLYRGSHLLGAVRAPSFRCHVVIFGRPFAFNCYELLVLADE